MAVTSTTGPDGATWTRSGGPSWPTWDMGCSRWPTPSPRRHGILPTLTAPHLPIPRSRNSRPSWRLSAPAIWTSSTHWVVARKRWRPRSSSRDSIGWNRASRASARSSHSSRAITATRCSHCRLRLARTTRRSSANGSWTSFAYRRPTRIAAPARGRHRFARPAPVRRWRKRSSGRIRAPSPPSSVSRWADLPPEPRCPRRISGAGYATSAIGTACSSSRTRCSPEPGAPGPGRPWSRMAWCPTS